MAKKDSYDRIFRENIEQLVVPLAHRLLNLTIPALEEIPDDLHQRVIGLSETPCQATRTLFQTA